MIAVSCHHKLLLDSISLLSKLRDLTKKDRKEFLEALDDYTKESKCPVVVKGLQGLGIYVVACSFLERKRARIRWITRAELTKSL